MMLSLLACTANGPVDEPAFVANATMDPLRLLTRASLDLRGVRPTEDEIRAIEDAPESVEDLIDRFLADPRFEDRMRDLFSEIYLTRADHWYVDGSSYGADSIPFAQSVGEEPLHLVARVAAEDLPWTDIVLADWTMANDQLAKGWPTDYPDGETGWRPVHYTDGRPAAGVLATNGMWWRYTTTASNANRGRANAVSRILLCNDYLVRPIFFEPDVDLLDAEAVSDAIRNNESCVNCHSSLDPLASYLFGFSADYYSATDAAAYHPEREHDYRDYTGVEPSYYGERGYTLTDLAHQIAADPRFPDCAVEQAWELLLRRDATEGDRDAMLRHREVFLASGLRFKALVRSIMDDERYRAADVDLEGGVPAKMVTPDLLATQIEDLTGFRWSYYGYDILRSDLYGLRTLAGGSDGLTVTSNATAPNTTVFLVQQRLAESAAAYAVDTEALLSPEERRLFTEIGFSEQADDPAIARQVQTLHRRIFGTTVALDGEEVAVGVTLWSSLYAVGGDTMLAWTGVLSALLRDPEILLY